MKIINLYDLSLGLPPFRLIHPSYHYTLPVLLLFLSIFLSKSILHFRSLLTSSSLSPSPNRVIWECRSLFKISSLVFFLCRDLFLTFYLGILLSFHFYPYLFIYSIFILMIAIYFIFLHSLKYIFIIFFFLTLYFILIQLGIFSFDFCLAFCYWYYYYYYYYLCINNIIIIIINLLLLLLYNFRYYY